MVPDPIKPAGTVYTPSPVIEIPVIKEEPKEEIVIKEIIKQAKEIVTEKMHKAAEVNAKNLPEDMIFHSLPNTGVDM